MIDLFVFVLVVANNMLFKFFLKQINRINFFYITR